MIELFLLPNNVCACWLCNWEGVGLNTYLNWGWAVRYEKVVVRGTPTSPTSDGFQILGVNREDRVGNSVSNTLSNQSVG